MRLSGLRNGPDQSPFGRSAKALFPTLADADDRHIPILPSNSPGTVSCLMSAT